MSVTSTQKIIKNDSQDQSADLAKTIWDTVAQQLEKTSVSQITSPLQYSSCKGKLSLADKSYVYEYGSPNAAYCHILTREDGKIIIRSHREHTGGPDYFPAKVTYHNQKTGLYLAMEDQGSQREIYKKIMERFDKIYSTFVAERDSRHSARRAKERHEYLAALKSSAKEML